MKKIITTTLAAGMAAALASTVSAEEKTAVVVEEEAGMSVSVTMDFASAYVFRGVTFNDGFVIQPGIEAGGFGLPEEYGAVSVGAWANYDVDDYDGNLASSEASEIDWYASYSLPTLIDGLDLFVGYCDYTYPNAEGTSDKEANVGLGFDIAGIALGATAYYGIGGAVSGSAYYEFSAGYDLEITEEFAASLGARMAYADPDSGDDGFSDYDIGLGLSYVLSDVWSVGASVTYIGQMDDDVLPDEDLNGTGDFGYDTEVVGMLSLAASF
ncbi:hypothetical protein SCARR_01942 [Pontiella sulfatireligans]|uniref:Outer membrane protein beta-barrel domain-containing protein n=2 Tax=Pontiella sulfatireligans TaxID=2750658 RepID=A0A6C2UI38_9BACT|nr:hypothetical protein SCARR_01942 [Pontiella sulfatireligans]